MKPISLAIPFYNTSKYFLDVIKYALDDDFISEICINDDASNFFEWRKLNKIIKSLNSKKIRVYRNKENLKAFRNKFNAVKNCDNEWVYLLDSDNHMLSSSLGIIKKINLNDPKIIYSPQNLFFNSDSSKKDASIVSYKFSSEIIGIKETIDIIEQKIKEGMWFLNTGNYILNKENYLNTLTPIIECDENKFLEACSIASHYYLIKMGTKFKIVEDLGHFHRIRKDSAWNVNGKKSQNSVDYYVNEILKLKE